MVSSEMEQQLNAIYQQQFLGSMMSYLLQQDITLLVLSRAHELSNVGDKILQVSYETIVPQIEPHQYLHLVWILELYLLLRDISILVQSTHLDEWNVGVIIVQVK
jgi:hypothetical protein